jgi:hypothetical protein
MPDAKQVLEAAAPGTFYWQTGCSFLRLPNITMNYRSVSRMTHVSSKSNYTQALSSASVSIINDSGRPPWGIHNELLRLLPHGMGVKRPEREADCSSPSSVQVGNVWRCTSTPPLACKVRCLIKQTANFMSVFLCAVC